jgi:hypothetical protein
MIPESRSDMPITLHRTARAPCWAASALIAITSIASCDGDDASPADDAAGSPGEAGRGGSDSDSDSGAAGAEPAGGTRGESGASSTSVEAGAAGEAGGSGGDRPTPFLHEASIADGSTEVYPFPLPDGVSISLTFSEAMSTETSEVGLRTEGGNEKAVPIVWAGAGTEASVVIAANPLTGAPPLLDRTSYALDLSLLASQHGVPLDRQRNLSDGALRFTTGAFDALLNHACGHVELGPFDSAVAGAMPGPLTVPTDVGHVNYTITLPRSAAGYEGYTRVTTLMGRHYHFLFDRETPVALVTASAAEEALRVEPAAAACAGITHRADFSAEANAELFLHLGPIATSSLHMVLEIVSDGNGD